MIRPSGSDRPRPRWRGLAALAGAVLVGLVVLMVFAPGTVIASLHKLGGQDVESTRSPSGGAVSADPSVSVSVAPPADEARGVPASGPAQPAVEQPAPPPPPEPPAP